MVFNTALSGIQTSSKDLEVIGNNIANSSTTGFKSSRTQFGDVYTSAAYGSASNATGAGVRLERVQQSFAPGNLTPTGNTLDLGISGSGFFILNGDQGPTYSRAGQFKLDKDNNIINGANQNLQGYALAPVTKTDPSTGLPVTTMEATGGLKNLSVSTANIPAKATTATQIGVNLNSNISPLITNIWDNTSTGTPANNTYNNIVNSTVYDSLGNSHTLSVYFIKANGTGGIAPPVSGEANTWFMAVRLDGKEVPVPPTTGSTAATVTDTVKLSTIAFKSDGSVLGVRAPNTTTAPTTESKLLTLPPIGITGADNLNITLDFGDSTQFASPFAVQSLSQNGYPTGSLGGLAIDENGVVSGRYTNGQSLALGQIALATFPDLEGLKSIGNSSWAATLASGQAVDNPAGGNGVGTINSGTLEDSNVDVTSELVALISAQRNFQANAQTIRTADTITQTIINIR